MAQPFKDRVVIVTGSARGLGRDYAKFFAQDGAKVVLADMQPTEAAAKAAEEAGAETLQVQTNVADRASVQSLMDQTKARFGRLDILVNNAGLWRRMQEMGLLGVTDEMWKATWDVNVTGTLLCYQLAVPLMKEGGWGRIVNISSMASSSGGNAYGLTKAAVEHMTQGMAREVGKFGITVNCVAPGITAFEGAKGGLPNMDQIVAGNAVQRLGTSRDLYEGIRYLCLPESEWTTGVTLRVDGGARAR